MPTKSNPPAGKPAAGKKSKEGFSMGLPPIPRITVDEQKAAARRPRPVVKPSKK